MKAKATGTYYNYGDQEITYNGYLYGFYLTGTDATGLPQNYKISSDVFENLIESNARGFQLDLASRIDTRGIVIADWALNGVENYCNFVYGLFANAYQALGSFSHDFIWSGTTTYSWNYYFTGADPDYPGNGQYGTAYGFRFIGACGDKFDFVLDANGDFYGHSVIGNWTPSEDPEPTDWILINQGLDNFYVPSGTTITFSDMKPPYFKGTSLYFYVYDGQGNEIQCHVDDMAECALVTSNKFFLGNTSFYFGFIDSKVSGTPPTRTLYYGNQSTNLSKSSTQFSFYRTKESKWYGGKLYGYDMRYINGSSFNYPAYYLDSNITSFTYNSYNRLGYYNNSFVNGTGEALWLTSFSYSPNPNPQPFPEEPIPITSIPENPEDPIPDTDPDPVPGIEYPINPTPIPLPPFPTIVSGNDDLWGQTVQLEGLENSLLPYLGSLAEFDFPSFSDLLTEYTGSIIWVAQIMSLLYNGTPLNILFIVLCLFSLVSILIGAYKLWSSTEPDPVNGGRRYKKPPRPPKGGKKH